jgi:beta-lactamase superfamily II metal-dependent hydrolase
MSTIHFLNVLEGDCNIIQHDSGRVSVIDVSNAYNDEDTEAEKAVKESEERKKMFTRTLVPEGKINYRQKEDPDNPIIYLKENIGTSNIFRFIVTHPDMDHLDGIKDLFTEFEISNVWDTDNNKTIAKGESFGPYNREDWDFYTEMRDGKYPVKRLTYHHDTEPLDFWNEDNLEVLCPSRELVAQANESSGDYHDASHVLLFTPPKKGGGKWKILFAGDSYDNSWNHIIENNKDKVKNIDILFAPHHGRDSNRDYDFLKILTPTVTLFGNASFKHLAYDCYPPIRITNNQAGYVIMDISEDSIIFYVKNEEFANDFRKKRNWGKAVYSKKFSAYSLCMFNAPS